MYNTTMLNSGCELTEHIVSINNASWVIRQNLFVDFDKSEGVSIEKSRSYLLNININFLIN